MAAARIRHTQSNHLHAQPSPDAPAIPAMRVCRRQPASEGKECTNRFFVPRRSWRSVLASAASAPARRRCHVVDSPRADATWCQLVSVVGGWAIDMAARTRRGDLDIHVWAYPDGGAPTRFASARCRQRRAARRRRRLRRRSSCSPASTSRPELAPGGYTLVLFPFSSITGAFDFARAYASLPITVACRAPRTRTEHLGAGDDAARAAVEYPSRRLRHRRRLQPRSHRDVGRGDEARRRDVQRDREEQLVGQPGPARGLQEPACSRRPGRPGTTSSRRSSGTGPPTARAT